MKHLSFLLLVALPMGCSAQQKQSDGNLGLTIGTSTIPDPYIYCTADEKLFCNPKGMVSVKAGDSTAIKLSDEEYANLQKLRHAVIDEEKRLAVKYGAYVADWRPCIPEDVPSLSYFPNLYCNTKGTDHYEFHKQFLLIDKDHASEISDTPAEILKHFGTEGMNKPIILNRFPDGSVLKGSAK